MNMKKFIFILISSIFVINSVKAQYDAQFSQNMNCLSFFNPAMASVDGMAKVIGLNRQQWVGLKHAPQTTVFNIAVPFQLGDVKQAGGILFFNDKAGLFSNQSVYLQYAYHRNFLKGLLSVGANLGFLNNTFDGTKVFIPESNAHTDKGLDVYIPNAEEAGTAFDMTLGVAYNDERKCLGISLAHLTNPKIQIGEKATVTVKPLLNITGGYNFFLANALYILKPSLFLKTDFASLQIDINTILEYKKRFFGGISYRYQDAVVLMVGANVAGVSVCYSYDITTSKLAKVSGGSHEVMLSYSFSLERSKKNKYKSIRIL